MQRVLPAALLYLALLSLCAIGGWEMGRMHAAQSPPASATVPATQAAATSPTAPTPVASENIAAPAAITPEAPRPAKAPSAVRYRPTLPSAPAAPAQPSADSAPAPQAAQPTAAAAPPPPAPPSPTPASALKNGVLIVISLPSQRAYVFKDGEFWDSARVSTGKPGKRTPAGTFTILQKQVHHRSTKYDDAPMPYMQRITWGGVALHAGHVPGYPASHGCIRLPGGFAKRLYRITSFDSTVVVVTKKRVHSSDEVRDLS